MKVAGGAVAPLHIRHRRRPPDCSAIAQRPHGALDEIDVLEAMIGRR